MGKHSTTVISSTIDSLIDGVVNQSEAVSIRRSRDDGSVFQMERLADEVARLTAMATSLGLITETELAIRKEKGL